jgi:hypothetical protein
MAEYEFELRFKLPSDDRPAVEYTDVLYEAGCDDALVGVGRNGVIALEFVREADSARAAIQSAIANVCAAIPGARLIEAAPDLVNMSGIATLFSKKIRALSRQAVRKYIEGGDATFPPAAVSGTSCLWHTHNVVCWAIENKKAENVGKANALLELSRLTKAINLAAQKDEDEDVNKLAERLVKTSQEPAGQEPAISHSSQA